MALEIGSHLPYPTFVCQGWQRRRCFCQSCRIGGDDLPPEMWGSPAVGKSSGDCPSERVRGFGNLGAAYSLLVISCTVKDYQSYMDTSVYKSTHFCSWNLSSKAGHRCASVSGKRCLLGSTVRSWNQLEANSNWRRWTWTLLVDSNPQKIEKLIITILGLVFIYFLSFCWIAIFACIFW